MTDGWKPLWIWARDHAEVDLDRLRQAKESLWLDYKVVPREYEVPTAFDRILAWDTVPPFPCEYVLVTAASSDAELERALAWVLEEGEHDGAMSMAESLSVVCGAEVREVSAEELEAERRLAAYQQGLE